MHAWGIIAGALILIVVLWDAFETIVLPRRVTRRLRLTRLFYRGTWLPFRALGRLRKPGASRENFLSVYGPLSLLLLLAIWAAGLIVGFAMLHWGLRTRWQVPPGVSEFAASLYFSGTTLFTIGLGDVAPTSSIGRVLTVLEGGTGLGFLALVVGYLPLLSQAFSRREVNISLLDARAGSPPTAAELLRRHAHPDSGDGLAQLLVEWERWSADLLETHISFPVLAYYRSQHENQSWVAALTTLLDVCALIIAGLEPGPRRTARLTYAMARHAVVDLSRVFYEPPKPPNPDRLPAEELAKLREALIAAGRALPADKSVEEKLARLRQSYEPYVNALGQFLLMPLPRWLLPERLKDNWQRTV